MCVCVCVCVCVDNKTIVVQSLVVLHKPLFLSLSLGKLVRPLRLKNYPF